jgi:hypothetical protein
MIDNETMKIAALVTLMAVIATILRRRLGLIAVVWAFAIGIFIAGRIAKMQAMRQLKETMMETAIMQDALNQEMQNLLGQIPPPVNFQPPTSPASPQITYQPEMTEPAREEAVEDEPIEDEWDDYGSDE